MLPRKSKAVEVVGEGLSLGTRDDFSEATKIELLVRAANLCSRCRVFTVGSTHAGDRKNSIGVAAHICAAASGPEPIYNFLVLLGVRFDGYLE